MGLKVDIAALDAAARSVAHAATAAEAVAGEVTTTDTGCPPVDDALGKLHTVWAAQVLALSDISGGMAAALSAAAASYQATDHTDAATYTTTPPAPALFASDHSGALK